MTWPQFQEKLARARHWYFPNAVGDEDVWAWYKAHTAGQKARQDERYFALEDSQYVVDLAHEAFDRMEEGQ